MTITFGNEDEYGPKSLQGGICDVVQWCIKQSANAVELGVFTPEEGIETACRSSLLNGMRFVLELFIDKKNPEIAEMIDWHNRCPPCEIIDEKSNPDTPSKPDEDEENFRKSWMNN